MASTLPTQTLSPRGVVLAAVAFDAQTEAVARNAVALAQRFAMEVRLINTLEPMLYDLITLETPAYPSYPPVDHVAEEMALKARQSAMEALTARLGKTGVKVTGVVTTGNIIGSVIAEATACRANMLVTGYNLEAYSTLTRGMSTALGLMHEAPLPVLAVAGDQTLNFNQPGLRLMVADDLQESTSEAVRRAFEFGAAIGNCHVRQVHVHGDIRELLKDGLHRVAEKLPLLRLEGGKGVEAYLADMFKARVSQLEQRGQPWRQMATDRGVKTEVDIRTGAVDKELASAEADYAPQLVIFGRHRRMRTRPFLVGRMTFRAMLKGQHSVLVVPAQNELYARLPFPAARD